MLIFAVAVAKGAIPRIMNLVAGVYGVLLWSYWPLAWAQEALLWSEMVVARVYDALLWSY